MFGKNAIAAPFISEAGSLMVHSIWDTIQGEGPDAGRPAIFIRLTGCNLRCFFCDTEFEAGAEQTLAQVLSRVEGLDRNRRRRLVVITGGEPLLQNIIPLVRELNRDGYEVSIETAGSRYVTGLEKVFAADRSLGGNLIVCSPKTPKLAPRLISLIGALKYVIRYGEVEMYDGLPNMSTQEQDKLTAIYRPCDALQKNVPIYLQPMDEEGADMRDKNLKTAAWSCMQFGYRLSVQMHKIAGLD